MSNEYERTGRVNFAGLTDSVFDLPKQTEVRDKRTGETRWVDGEVGDDNEDLAKHIENGDWYDEEEED